MEFSMKPVFIPAFFYKTLCGSADLLRDPVREFVVYPVRVIYSKTNQVLVSS